MPDDESRRRPPISLDPDLEREIRNERKFSLAEAIGRLAGPGMMKGTSPATRKQQAEAAIANFLDRHLVSAGGALSVVLLRHVTGSELLLATLDRPLDALARYVQNLLDSEHVLQDFVRETDVEWGRVYGERPYFERPGSPPNAEDPYTMASVRATLTQLLESIVAEASGQP